MDEKKYEAACDERSMGDEYEARAGARWRAAVRGSLNERLEGAVEAHFGTAADSAEIYWDKCYTGEEWITDPVALDQLADALAL